MALTDNIISYWKMEGNANDSTASANNGTSTNITYNTSNGKIDQGAGFNGSTSAITFTNNAGLKPTSWTVNFWVKTSTDSDDTLIENFDTTTGRVNGWRITFVSTGPVLLVDVGNDSGNTLGTNYARVTYGGVNFDDGTFRMVTVTWDNVADTLTAFVNGSSVATYSSFTAGIGYPAGAAFQMGNGSLGRYNGAIDEVGYWSRVLTGSEITQLYNGGSGLAYPFSTPNSNFLAFM